MRQKTARSTKRLQHSSLSEVAFEILRRQIISLELAPGERLNLDKLAVDLGVSPTPLREALNRLAAERLIRIETYRGFIVEPLLNSEQLVDLCAVRKLLERFAIESTIDAISDETITELRQDVEAMDLLIACTPFDGLEFNELDQAFHRRIILATGNGFLEANYAALNVHVQIARLFQQRAVEHSSPANKEHRVLLEAIARRDWAAAVEALDEHIRCGQDRLLSLMAQLQTAS